MAKMSSVIFISIEEKRTWYGRDVLPVDVTVCFQREHERCATGQCRLYVNPSEASQFRVLRAQELAAGMEPVVHRVSVPRDEAEMGGVEPQMVSVRRIDELLDDLDSIARSHSSYEYGLPIDENDGSEQDSLRMAVVKWLGVVGE